MHDVAGHQPDRHQVPEHVAVYAAAIYTAGFGSWMDVQGFIAQIGMGDYNGVSLMDAARAWERDHVPPGARRTIRRRMKRAWNPSENG
jgi:hypothetical protein